MEERIKMKKHPSRPIQKKRKVKRPKVKKQLRRTRGSSAEKMKIKMRWMNALQALVGEISINWTVAAMYYDQGMPVQAAFQKLIVKEEKKVKSFKEYAYPKRENYVKKGKRRKAQLARPGRWRICRRPGSKG